MVRKLTHFCCWCALDAPSWPFPRYPSHQYHSPGCPGAQILAMTAASFASALLWSEELWCCHQWQLETVYSHYHPWAKGRLHISAKSGEFSSIRQSKLIRIQKVLWLYLVAWDIILQSSLVTWLNLEAMWREVHPKLSAWFTSAPCFNSKRMTFLYPLAQAIWSCDRKRNLLRCMNTQNKYLGENVGQFSFSSESVCLPKWFRFHFLCWDYLHETDDLWRLCTFHEESSSASLPDLFHWHLRTEPCNSSFNFISNKTVSASSLHMSIAFYFAFN